MISCSVDHVVMYISHGFDAKQFYSPLILCLPVYFLQSKF